MVYTHLFETNAQFNAAYTGDSYIEPWVSYTRESNTVAYNKPDPTNGHPYVDLGLPSGTLWATCNVGASSPEESGNYYAWGDPREKDDWDDDNYLWGNPTTKYNYTDGLTELETEDDVAHVIMGGEWHIPTISQVKELLDNTAWIDTTINGVDVKQLISNINGNTIVFPYLRNGADIPSSTVETSWTNWGGSYEGYNCDPGYDFDLYYGTVYFEHTFRGVIG